MVPALRDQYNFYDDCFTNALLKCIGFVAIQKGSMPD